MALLPIVKYGDPVLHHPAEPVGKIDDELKKLVADMVQTMYAAPGVGLAAPQVGVALRLAVIDTSVGERPDELLVLINPEITALEGEQELDEGCLSAPGFSEATPRAAIAELRALDLDGREWTRRADGLLARAFQHEVDHLDGKLFVERLPALRRAFLTRKIKKKARLGDWA